jgi:hypothetical protein
MMTPTIARARMPTGTGTTPPRARSFVTCPAIIRTLSDAACDARTPTGRF